MLQFVSVQPCQDNMATHTAAWIKHKHAPLELGPVETPTPGPGEILVEVRFIAFSPIESKQQK